MSLLTTTIGAYPKPDYIPVPDWFRAEAGPDTADPTGGYLKAIEKMGAEAEEIFARGTREAIRDQVDCGIDVPTDGEIRRENYIHYHCRHLNGFDFAKLTRKAVRGGTYEANLPTITGAISAKEPFLHKDWLCAQSFTDRPVKITLPGPLTIADTNANSFYDDPRALGRDLAVALNQEIQSLAAAGCRWIQVDEPVFARKPAEALDYGIDNLNRCFEGVPAEVNRCMHMCCGYPDKIDRDDYLKADPGAYRELAEAVDDSTIDAVSIEDAHCHNDLSLLERFSKTVVIFGVVAIAKSRVETTEEIRTRIGEALEHISGDRLVIAPDCGLGFLGRDLTKAKLTNMCEAAKSF